ncbi:hydroxyethylthiazole kinase [Christensenellaceae bacterium OttesenSCG-928-M15]|nr:hydroxyethylthiazole kinase [Christensenellaceae bacterium OttesenSCG-928-M15]
MGMKPFELIEGVRIIKPLIHHITNYVTVNDCANITLAIGASPIMADAIEEAADIASISSAVVLNMGTLNARTIPSMIAAGKAANERGIPVVFDPVGAGASKYRNETVATIVKEVRFSVIRGNVSEIRYLAGLQADTKGVDAAQSDMISLREAKHIAQSLALQLKCIIAITGATDIVSDGDKVVCIENGHEMLSNLTGTGCMCSSLIGSYCGAAVKDAFCATVAALLSMGIAGEIAYEKAGACGNGSFRAALHDAVSRMDKETMEKRGHFYEA